MTSIYRSEEVDGLDEAGLLGRARRDLALALGSPQEPEVMTVATRSWNDVIPRYGVGHARRMREVEAGLQAGLPGVALAGSYVGGVSVEECIARARAVANALV